MRSAENIEKLVKNLDLDINTNVRTDQVILSELLEEQEKFKKTQSAFALPAIRRIIMKSPITKLAVAAMVIVAVLIGFNPFGSSKTSVLWADVAERFESVPFFHLTMYIGYDTSGETKKIEIWKSEDSRVRAHEGNTVVFADFTSKEGRVLIFDLTTKEPVNINGQAPMFLQMLCKQGRFSLDTLTSSFPPEVKGIAPVETIDTAASRETVLFEAKHETTPERLMIWALRQSKLPIRLIFSDPRKSEYGDFIFDYSERKNAAFFDPSAFKSQ